MISFLALSSHSHFSRYSSLIGSQYQILRDSAWMRGVGWEPIRDEYREKWEWDDKARKEIIVGMEDSYIGGYEPISFSMEGIMQKAADIIINNLYGGRNAWPTERKYKTQTKQTFNAKVGYAETLAEMAQFAVSNPTVQYVEHLSRGKHRYWDGMPTDSRWNLPGTNYEEFREWLKSVGKGDMMAGYAKISAFPALVIAARNQFIATPPLQNEYMRTAYIERAVGQYQTLDYLHGFRFGKEIPLSWRKLCDSLFQTAADDGARLGFFTDDERSKRPKSNPLTPAQQEIVRGVIKRYIDNLKTLTKTWRRALR